MYKREETSLGSSLSLLNIFVSGTFSLKCFAEEVLLEVKYLSMSDLWQAATHFL